MPANFPLSELFKIVEGANRQDAAKVRNYTELLAQKLEADGDVPSARRLRRILQDNGGVLHALKMEQKPVVPVDGESRFPLVEVGRPVSGPKYAASGPQAVLIQEFIAAVKNRAELERHGLFLNTNLLLFGPPGCGKTQLALHLGAELNLPVYTARLDGLISSYLGNTAKNLRAVFEFAARTPCVLFLDEFDAIAKLRDDQQELGELKRVVNSFIQTLDNYSKDLILIAATNHEQLLDSAIWRRFRFVLHVPLPDLAQRNALWQSAIGADAFSAEEFLALADVSGGYSGAAIVEAGERVRQAEILRKEKPTLRGVLLFLVSRGRPATASEDVLSEKHLDSVESIALFVRGRTANIYTQSILSELAGVSRATLNRHLKTKPQ